MACNYTLKINRETLTFASEQELIDFFNKNQDIIVNNNMSDIVYSGDKVRESELILNRALYSEVIDSQLYEDNFDYYVGDYTQVQNENNKKDNEITLTKLLEDYTFKDDNGEDIHIVTPFDLDKYTENKIKEYIESGDSEEVAKEKVAKDLKTFRIMGDTSLGIKAIYKKFMNAKLLNISTSTIEAPNVDVITLPVLNNTIVAFEHMYSNLKYRHPGDSKIIPNVVLKDKLPNGNTVIVPVDAIVIDSDGKLSLYNLKTTHRDESEIELVTQRKYDYELGIARQILARKGFDIEDISLNIIPFKIDGIKKFGKVTNVNVGNTNNRLSEKSTTANKLTPDKEIGKYFSNIDNLFPIAPVTTNQSPIKDIVFKKMDSMFPSSALGRIRNEIDIDTFIKNKVWASTEDGFTWQFKDNVTGDIIKIKDKSDKNNNSELRLAVSKYNERRIKHNLIKIKTFGNDIAGLINGTKEYTDVVGKTDLSHDIFIRQTFNKYKNQAGWEIIDYAPLNQLGIIVIGNNKTKQLDFIGLSYYNYLNTSLNSLDNNNKKGRTSLLGMYLNDSELGNGSVLKATNGNIDLIKIMVAINENTSFLGNYQIGDIKIINPSSDKEHGNQATVADRKTLIRTYNRLMNLSKNKNNITENMFKDNIQLMLDEFLSVITSDRISENIADRKSIEAVNDLIKEDFGVEENYKSMSNIMKVEKLKKILTSLSKTLNIEGGETALASKVSSPEFSLYLKVCEAISFYSGYEIEQPQTISKWGFSKGTRLIPPEQITDSNIRNIHNLIRRGLGRTKDLTSEYMSEFSGTAVMKLWESKGYTSLENKTIGNQNRLYENMWRVNPETGKVNERMLLKDPSDTSLTKGESEFLDEFLWRINQFRFNLKDSDRNTSKVQTLKDRPDLKWYWAPLVKSEKTLTQGGISGYIENKMNSYENLKSKAGDWLDMEMQGVYSKEELNIREDASKKFEMYNRFSYMESSQEIRDFTLSKRTNAYWDNNLETLMAAYSLENIRKNKLNEVLPIIKAIRFIALYHGEMSKVDNENMMKLIDDMLDSTVFEKTILSKEEQQMNKYVAPIKNFATKMVIGFNTFAPVRDYVSGLHKAVSLAASKMYLGEDTITFNNIMKGYSYVMKNAFSTIEGVNFIDALNRKGGFADLDINRLIRKLTSDKSGVANLGGKFFWTSTVGDYMNRLSLLVAKLKQDGSFDAIKLKDKTSGTLIYDWKKDKRFEAYARGDKTNPEYNRQRAKYINLMNSFNESRALESNFKSLIEGDALPFAYSDLEMRSFKSFLDFVYGHYDSEVKAMEAKSFWGGLLLQFRTYLQPTRTAYLLKPGEHNIYKEVQKRNDNGELLYYELNKDGSIKTDESGELVTTVNKTDIPVLTQIPRYMEGIVYTLKNIFNEVVLAKGDKTRGEAFKTIWSDETKRAALSKMGVDLSLLVILGGLTKALMEIWRAAIDEDKNFSESTALSALNESAYDILSKGLTRSFDDVSVNAVSGIFDRTDILTISYVTDLFSNTGEFIAGEKPLSKLLYESNAGARSLKPFVSEITRVVNK